MTADWIQPLDVAGVLRAARHVARLSQRELASLAGTSQRHVVRLETGAADPTVGVLSRLLAVTDHRLVVRDEFSLELRPLSLDHLRDDADRHLPAAVDLRPVRQYGDWWLDRAPIAMLRRRPEWTFDLARKPPPRGATRARRADDGPGP